MKQRISSCNMRMFSVLLHVRMPYHIPTRWRKQYQILMQKTVLDGSTYWTENCTRWQHLLDSQNIQSFNQDKKEIIVYVINECEQNNLNKIYIMLLNI